MNIDNYNNYYNDDNYKNKYLKYKYKYNELKNNGNDSGGIKIY